MEATIYKMVKEVELHDQVAVSLAFKKFDKDNSNTIDKDELTSVIQELTGYPLDQSKLDAAFKDLDINKDGIIDYSEFRTWYFSGMKPFSNSRGSLLYAMKGILAFNKATADPKLLEFVT